MGGRQVRFVPTLFYFDSYSGTRSVIYTFGRDATLRVVTGARVVLLVLVDFCLWGAVCELCLVTFFLSSFCRRFGRGVDVVASIVGWRCHSAIRFVRGLLTCVFPAT